MSRETVDEVNITEVFMKTCDKVLVSDESEKICAACQERYPIRRFYRDGKSPDGKMSVCRWCHAANGRRWRRKVLAKDPNHFKAQQKGWRAKRIEEGRV